MSEAQIRSLKTREFAQAAISFGSSSWRIMLRELLPNAVASIVVASTLNVAHAILAESYISFLGFGIQPPTPSRGNMLESGQSYLTSAPWLAIIPGAAIALAVTSFNLLAMDDGTLWIRNSKTELVRPTDGLVSAFRRQSNVRIWHSLDAAMKTMSLALGLNH